MNTLLWIGQAALAALFFYSGIMKSTQPEARLVAMGQTGVEGLPAGLITFIGVAELAGGVGLLLPWWSGVLPWLTPVAALALGVVMILAAAVHLRRGERRQAAQNGIILLLCLLVAYGRFGA